MKKDASKLKNGDEASLKQETSIRYQVTNKISEEGASRVRLEVKFIPCGETCSADCHCLYALSGESDQTLVLSLPPNLRANNVVNLEDLMREHEERQQLIDKLRRLKNGNGATSEDSVLEPTHE